MKIKRGLKLKVKDFEQKSISESVEKTLQNFKSILMTSIDKYMSQKPISMRWDVPWLTRALKRKLKQKQRIYTKAKNTDNPTHWIRVKQTRTKLEDAYNNYILNLLESCKGKGK